MVFVWLGVRSKNVGGNVGLDGEMKAMGEGINGSAARVAWGALVAVATDWREFLRKIQAMIAEITAVMKAAAQMDQMGVSPPPWNNAARAVVTTVRISRIAEKAAPAAIPP